MSGENNTDPPYCYAIEAAFMEILEERISLDPFMTAEHKEAAKKFFERARNRPLSFETLRNLGLV